MSFSKAVALLRAETEFTRVMARLFTTPVGCGVRTIYLDSNDADCMALETLGLVRWASGPGGWIFTDLGNTWLKSMYST